MLAVVSGGSGALASMLKEASKSKEGLEIESLSKVFCDIRYEKFVEEALSKHAPDVFIHAAARAQPMSFHEEKPGESMETNIKGTCNVAKACMNSRVKLVYISTDYVYPGTEGDYREEDPTNPFNNYGLSKLGGECAARMVPGSLILRCSFTKRPFKHKLAFSDSYRSYMYDDEIASLILDLVQGGAAGIFNVGGPRQSVYEFVRDGKGTYSPATKDSVQEFIPEDTSMDTYKLRKYLRGQETYWR